MAMSEVNLFLLLTLVSMFSFVNSLRFDLQSGGTKCISEDIKSNAMTVGKYSVVNPNEGYPVPDDYKLTVRVSSPYGNNYHYGDHVDSGNFAFTAAEAGDYTACFWAAEHKPPTTKGQVEVMEFELKKLYDTVASIHDEMFYLREREEEMQELNRATNSKMTIFSFLSLLVCLSVAGLQLWHLKTFFERKKLL
ncbi:Transmembrane emp24 domain-containing protein [Quillaja saponaria]|uniref:Transmembrane emp24 domain-containing protein n=1 Tax=Quillaja saponaria TaxID=32244 RepID=A0AAD7VG33_QUISA|nr:Transmembrane emp24 domain-containing protein [Quillaja saponaria]